MAEDPADLEELIAQNAADPRSATEDGLTVSQHSLPDQIAADRYLKSEKAVRTKRRGLSFTKLRPPGTQ